MKIGLQFAMPAELHALPGARDLSPAETVSGVPFFEVSEKLNGSFILTSGRLKSRPLELSLKFYALKGRIISEIGRRHRNNHG